MVRRIRGAACLLATLIPLSMMPVFLSGTMPATRGRIKGVLAPLQPFPPPLHQRSRLFVARGGRRVWGIRGGGGDDDEVVGEGEEGWETEGGDGDGDAAEHGLACGGGGEEDGQAAGARRVGDEGEGDCREDDGDSTGGGSRDKSDDDDEEEEEEEEKEEEDEEFSSSQGQWIRNPTYADLEGPGGPNLNHTNQVRWRSKCHKAAGMHGPLWGDPPPPLPDGAFRPYGMVPDDQLWIGETLDGKDAFYGDLDQNDPNQACDDGYIAPNPKP